VNPERILEVALTILYAALSPFSAACRHSYGFNTALRFSCAENWTSPPAGLTDLADPIG
jgi:hypothetical protein